MASNNDSAAVRVVAPARLHLGFLDLTDARRRRFGSIGVGITGFSTVVTVSRSARLDVPGPEDAAVAGIAQTILDRFHIRRGVRIRIEQSIPRHQGLGSGTQMALALGSAITRLYGVDAGADDIALATGRGARSGIGLGVFQHGGFILDSGAAAGRSLPTLLFRHDFPEQWRFVLVMDGQAEGVSGAAEAEAFASLPDMAPETSAAVCQQVLMRLLPGIVEQDCEQFGASVSRVQAHIGDCFSAVQGGRYASDRVGRALKFLSEHKATGVGQTSWGPTGFALFPDRESARLAMDAYSRAGGDDGITLQSVQAENRGAHISTTPKKM